MSLGKTAAQQPPESAVFRNLRIINMAGAAIGEKIAAGGSGFGNKFRQLLGSLGRKPVSPAAISPKFTPPAPAAPNYAAQLSSMLPKAKPALGPSGHVGKAIEALGNGIQLGPAAYHAAAAPVSWVRQSPTTLGAAGRAALLSGGALAGTEALQMGLMTPGQRTRHFQNLNDPNQPMLDAAMNPLGELLATQYGRELTRNAPQYGAPIRTEHGMSRPITGNKPEYTPMGEQRVDNYQKAMAGVDEDVAGWQRQLDAYKKQRQEAQKWWYPGAADALQQMSPPSPAGLPPAPNAQPSFQPPIQAVPQRLPSDQVAERDAIWRAYLAGQ